MGFIARRIIKQDLQNVEVLLNDTNNDYFNLVEIPTTFVQGRSAFKIFGSPFLKTFLSISKTPLLKHKRFLFVSSLSKKFMKTCLDMYLFFH